MTRFALMQKKFIGNMLFIQLLNLLVKVSWILLIDRVVQNLLGPEIYGQYFIVFNFALVFILILDMGINNYNAINVSTNPSFIFEGRRGILRIKVVLAILYMAVVSSLGLFKGYQLFLLLLLGFNQVVIGFVQYFRSNLAGMQKFVQDGILSVMDKFIALVVCGGLLLSDHITIELFVAAQTFGLITSLLLALTFNLKTTKSVDVSEIKFSSLEILKKSFPFALLLALMTLYTRVDTVMLDLMLDKAEYHAGIYAQSFRLLDAATIFAIIISGLLLPMFSRILGNGKSPKELVSIGSRIILVPVIWVAFFAFFFGVLFMDKMYVFHTHADLLYSSTVFASLMIAFVAMSLVYVYGTLLTAAKEIKSLNRYATISLVANVILNFFFIQSFSEMNRPAEGVALATLITQWLFVIPCIYKSFTIFGLKANVNFILKVVVFFAILCGVYFYLLYLNYEIEQVLVIYLLASILFLFLLRLIEVKAIFKLWKNKSSEGE